jgi:hypothetical protein
MKKNLHLSASLTTDGDVYCWKDYTRGPPLQIVCTLQCKIASVGKFTHSLNRLLLKKL